MTECIYNFVPKPQSEHLKSSRYKSKYDPQAPLTGSTFGLHGTTVTVGKGINELKKTCVVSSTFGPRPNATKSTPTNFLRKNSRPIPEVKGKKDQTTSRYIRPGDQTQKPPVPLRDDKPIMGLKTCKSFVTSNAAEAILSVPPAIGRGDTNFMEKENYGKVPEYLGKVKEEIRHENEIIDRYVREHSLENGGTRHQERASEQYEVLDEEERNDLINQLKLKWDNVNSKYQKICHRVNIDTTGDLKRKEAQEAELEQLEEDIRKLSRPGPLMIRKDTL